ncbi:peptidoglycan DD-metalloendopeptidase family protein [Candidatus Nomurabacteria bacterium]|nr:peptidoglycan DD-metalloendopeptidase family protein [Candidatus Nomurabacteria bacterium]
MNRILFFSLIIVVLLGSPFFAYSNETGGTKEEIQSLNDEIAGKRSKISQIEKSIVEYKKKIEEKQLESLSLKNQLGILENRTTEIDLDIKLIEEKLATINLEIERLEIGIDLKENDIKRQQAITAELLRTIQKSSEKNFVEILSAYGDVSRFFNKIQHLKNVESDLAKGTRALHVAKVSLEEQNSETQKRRAAYKQLQDELEQRKLDLEEQKFAKEDILVQTKNSEQVFRTMVVGLRNQYQAIENEIGGIERQIRDKLEAQKKLELLPVDPGGKFSWPTQSRYVTAYFHDPDYPYRHVFEHNGIDIRSAHGTPLHAAGTGYIARAKKCADSKCYSYVMIVHSGGLATVYGHMSKIVVQEEQFVTRGDVIGYSGGTPGTVGAGPFVTGAHLHFEVRKNGVPVNPLNYLVRDWD